MDYSEVIHALNTSNGNFPKPIPQKKQGRASKVLNLASISQRHRTAGDPATLATRPFGKRCLKCENRYAYEGLH